MPLLRSANSLWYYNEGLPWGLDHKESVCQSKRHGFDPWVRKIWRKGMATHSTILAWKIPCAEGPGWLQSVGSESVRHYSATNQQLWWKTQWTKNVCHTFVSAPLWPHGLKPARLLCPWDSSRQEYWSGLPLLLIWKMAFPEVELGGLSGCGPPSQLGWALGLESQPPGSAAEWNDAICGGGQWPTCRK